MLHHDNLPVLVFNDAAFRFLRGPSYTMPVEPFDCVDIRESKESLKIRVELLDKRTRIVEKDIYCLAYLDDNKKSINGTQLALTYYFFYVYHQIRLGEHVLRYR